ncbi:hypothetical protein [Streptomyces sp. NPDC006552]|uniref:hypothetical protein n=1 Tax=Streptomyces sp. NPDC006552 TaxID=3157179 RepID=UPI0033A01AC1
MSDAGEPCTSHALDGVTVEVCPLEGADPELVAIGERYWHLAGFYPDTNVPAWGEKTSVIDTQGWGKPLYAVAAAGVRAVVSGRQCPQCEGPLSLSSRTAFAQLLEGVVPACVKCTPSLVAAVEAVLDPRRKAKRDAARERAQQQRALEEDLDRWTSAQREVMAERYALVFQEQVPRASVRQMTAALALMRYAPATTPLSKAGAWADPWYPNREQLVPLLGELVRAELLQIHPDSPPSAMVWEPETLEQARMAADTKGDEIPSPQLTDDFYPLRASFYAPFGTSEGTGSQRLDATMTARLAPEHLTAGQHDDLLALARELIAEEALRYFTARLADLNLPEVPDLHVERLREAAYRAAAHRNLGEMYNLAWRATRGAAEAAQKNPRAPRGHMSTHAVNRFETDAQRAAADPDWELKPFDEVAGCGLSAMTRTLFFTVLNLVPTKTSLPDIIRTLPEPAETDDDTLSGSSATHNGTEDGDEDELSSLVAWLGATPDAWDPASVTHILSTLQEHGAGMEHEVDERIVRAAAARLAQLEKRLLQALGERHTALAVLVSTWLLTHPVTNPVSGETAPVGEIVHRHLAHALFNLPSDHQDISL